MHNKSLKITNSKKIFKNSILFSFILFYFKVRKLETFCINFSKDNIISLHDYRHNSQVEIPDLVSESFIVPEFKN